MRRLSQGCCACGCRWRATVERMRRRWSLAGGTMGRPWRFASRSWRRWRGRWRRRWRWWDWSSAAWTCAIPLHRRRGPGWRACERPCADEQGQAATFRVWRPPSRWTMCAPCRLARCRWRYGCERLSCVGMSGRSAGVARRAESEALDWRVREDMSPSPEPSCV